MRFTKQVLLSFIILLIAIIIFTTSWSICYRYNNDIYKVTIDSLTAVIDVKQSRYDSLQLEHSLTNARWLKATLKQIKHTNKLNAEISGRQK